MRALIGALAAVITSLAFFAPVLSDLPGRIAGGTGDPLLVTYLFTWVGEHLGTPAVWHPPFLFPDRDVLTYSDHLFGFGLGSRMLTSLGLGPAEQFNLFSIAGFGGVFFGLYMWSREGGGRSLASLAAAALATYSAHRWGQVGHLQVQFLPFFTLTLWLFERARRSGSQLAIWAAAACLAAQILCTPSMAAFFVPALAFWVMLSLALHVRPVFGFVGQVHLVVAGAVALGLQWGWVHRYLEVHERLGLERTLEEIRSFSAHPVDWVSASPAHWLYRETWQSGLFHHTLGSERELFPGILVAGLVLAASASLLVWRRSNRFALASLGVAAACLLFMTGPSPGGLSLLHLPYDLLSRIPAMDSVRVPTRFLGLAGFFFVPVLADFFGRWEAHRRKGRRTAARVGIVLVSFAALAEGLPGLSTWDVVPDYVAGETGTGATALEGTAPGQTTSPKTDPRGTALGTTGVLENETRAPAILFLPVPPLEHASQEIERMWRAREIGALTANGYSGYQSVLSERIRALQSQDTSERKQEDILSWLGSVGVTGLHFADESTYHSWVPPKRRNADDEPPFTWPIPSIPAPDLRLIPLDSPYFEVTHGYGWSVPEQGESDRWVWSTGGRAQLWVPISGRADRTLRIRARTLAVQAEAEMSVRWNDTRLGRRSVARTPGWVEYPVSAAVQKEGWNEVVLIGPSPIRPADVESGSRDRRPLSLCAYEIEILRTR